MTRHSPPVRALARVAFLAAAFVASTTPARAAAPGSPSLATLYGELRAPKVVGSIPAPARLAVGRATLEPAAGARLLVLEAAGRRCGWVLDGPASLSYRVDDRFSAPVTRHNLEDAAGVRSADTGEGLLLTASLRGAAVWSWGELPGEGQVQPGPAATPAWLLEFVERKLTDNPERDMLLALRNGEPGYQMALLHLAGDDLLLDVDPRPQARAEVLGQLRKLGPEYGHWSGRWAYRSLATQPIGRHWLEPTSYDFTAVDYDIDLVNASKDHLAVTSRSRIELHRDGLTVLPFALVDETWEKRATRRENRIVRALVDGQAAPYFHREGMLLLELPRPYGKGESLAVEVATEGDVLERPDGDSYWLLEGGWYPVPSLNGRERAEIRMSVAVAQPFVPFSGGEILERTSADGMNRVRTKLASPMYFPVVLAGKYSSVTREQNGRRIHVSTYAEVRPKEAERVAGVAFAAGGCMERWLGVPYPFQDLQIVEVNQWGWAQAPPGVLFVTKEAFVTQARAESGADNLEWIAEVTGRGINERIAHEVAHGWFPHVAQVERGEENWLSESLSDYAAAYCMSQVMGKQGRQHFERQLREWREFSKDAGATSVFLAAHLSGDDAGLTRYKLLYGRGPLLLHAVRLELERKHGAEQGEKMFLTWIRSYVKSFTYKVTETRHLVAILDQVSGEKWMPFFERHLLGAEPPQAR